MIDLYTATTANGQKAAIMLEEAELAYTPHVIDLIGGQHQSPEFLTINPVGKVPVIVDPDGPGGAPITVCETAAILLYLAEKTRRLLPDDPRERAATFEWLAIVASDISPAFTGQFLFNVLAPEKLDFPIRHYDTEIARYLAVMDGCLAARAYLAGNTYSIADVIAYPVATTSAARTAHGLTPFHNIQRWVDSVGARPAVQRGMKAGFPEQG